MRFSFTFWVLQTVAMTITALVLPGLRVTSLFGALLAVLLLALVNALIWDAALFFHIPDSLSMTSLFILLVNGALFWLAVKLAPGMQMKGVLPAILAPLVFTASNVLLDTGFRHDWLPVVDRAIEALQSVRGQLVESKRSRSK